MPSAIGPCGWHSPDLPGHGVLRLTGNGDHQVGFAIYTQPVDASLGLNISFDAYQYDSATKRHRGADGIAFVLIDSPQVRQVNLNDIPGQPALPPTVKFGFTGATGDETAIHEVSNLVVSALRPDLLTRIRGAGRFRAQGTSTLVATVSDDAASGPATGTVTGVIMLPGPLTPLSAAGPGWTCAISGLKVRCAHPGTLPPGISFPPITVTASVAPGAPRRLTAESSGTTPGNYLSPGNVGYATTPVDVAPPGPDLMLAVRPVGALVAGTDGKFRLDVSNAPGPGRRSGRYRSRITRGRTARCCHRTAPAGPARCAGELLRDCHSSWSTRRHKRPGQPAGDPGLGTRAVAEPQPAAAKGRLRHHVYSGGHQRRSHRCEERRAWNCVATPGSDCPAGLGAGGLHARLYVASGGTVTLTATGQSDGAATVPETATLYPPSADADRYCTQAHPCTVTGSGAAGRIAM